MVHGLAPKDSFGAVLWRMDAAGGGAAISSRDLIELSNYLWTPDKDGQLPACLAVDRSGAACSAHMKLPAVKTDGIYILAWKRHAGSIGRGGLQRSPPARREQPSEHRTD